MPPETLPHKLRYGIGKLSVTYNIGRRWSTPLPPPKQPEPLSDVPLCAVITSWCEADIIASTVKNAFTQGCQRVFLVDNDSPDGTVGEAIAAGAEIGSVYETHTDNLSRRTAEVRDVIQRISHELGAPHVWWLTCDADEFPHGPAGLTLQEYLAGLDRRYRVVGARVFNHYPSTEPANRPGRHPLDYQPLCQEVKVAWCSLRHWKHPLMRWDHDGPPLWPGEGFHRLAPSEQRVPEPTNGIFLHHFQYRDRATTLWRLEQLRRPSAAGVPRSVEESEVGHRLKTITDVYAKRWESVPLPSVHMPKLGVEPKPWKQLVTPKEANVKRWYNEGLGD